jgi:hypothetical protein
MSRLALPHSWVYRASYISGLDGYPLCGVMNGGKVMSSIQGRSISATNIEITALSSSFASLQL